jgi:hypothetical protein
MPGFRGAVREAGMIDGSFFSASANNASIKTKEQLELELAAIER